MANTTGSLNYYCVKDYGAVGDGVTDDTAAVRGAVEDASRDPNKKGGVLFFPPGNYRLSTIKIPKPMIVRGSGRLTTIILARDLDRDLFVVASGYVSFSDLTMTSATQQSAGAFIHFLNDTGFGVVRDFYMQRPYKGILLESNAPYTRIECGDIVGPVDIGISIEAPHAGRFGLDVYIRAVGIQGTVAQRPTAGIYIQNTGDVYITDCDITLCHQGLLIRGGSGIYAQNNFFDTCEYGIYMSAEFDIINNHFIGNGTSNASICGVLIEAGGPAHVNNMEFNGHQCIGEDPLATPPLVPPKTGFSIGRGTNLKIVNSNIYNFGNAQGGSGIMLGPGTRFCMIGNNTVYDPRPNPNVQAIAAVLSQAPGSESYHIITNNFLSTPVNNSHDVDARYRTLIANNVVLPPGIVQ